MLLTQACYHRLTGPPDLVGGLRTPRPLTLPRYRPVINLFHNVTAFTVCSDLRNTGASGLILPNDLCASGCDQLGSIIGDAYSPVMALDQSGGSGAFKMVPSLSDIKEMLSEVISNFRWQSFIFLYEGDTG